MKKSKRKVSYKKIFMLVISLVFIFGFLVLFLFNEKNIKMENFVGKKLMIVEKFIDKHSILLEVKEEYNNEFEKGIVIDQSIKEGTNLKKDMKILVTVSKGKIDKSVYKEFKVNELGRVPVMMYHGIEDIPSSDTKYTGGNVDRDGYHRTKEAFISDLEFFYQNGYRMIRLLDYVNGIIDVELGKSPIILTFDDGLRNNINVLGVDDKGEIIIDPASAVGVLESFKKKYPDFNVTATFFLNGGLFRQTKYNEEIIKWLINNGYDIGNHTYTHNYLDRISEDKVFEEVGRMYKLLDDIIPGKQVNVVALPFGIPTKKTHDNFKRILEGSYEGFEYKTISTLRVGWEPEFSPFSKNFDKEYIKRVRAWDNNGLDFDIEYTFKRLETNRYISDGDKEKIVVKESDLPYLTETNLEVISY